MVAKAPLLQCRDLACGYLGRSVLEGVNLQVLPGDSVALLGPNGSGKSTLLKTIVKSLAPLAGSVLLGDDNLDRLPYAEVARRAAFVPQEEATPFAFSVRDIVLMGRIARSPGIFDTDEDLKIAHRAMERTDCLGYADRPITDLSGGEKQRVLIARALAHEAPLMLLDEPTSHLDAGHQLAVARLVAGLAEEGSATLIAVHDLNLASLLARRAVLISGGRIVLDGPVEEVLESRQLDVVYGVPFTRVRLDSGRLLVVPG